MTVESGSTIGALLDKYPFDDLDVLPLIDPGGNVYGHAVTTTREPQTFRSPFQLQTGRAIESVGLASVGEVVEAPRIIE